MELDSTLCYCFHIKKRKIVNFVRQTKPRRASQISECFGAGTGCGWCIPFLRRIHQQVVAGEIVESDDISDGEYEALRTGYLRDVKDGSRQANTHACSQIPAELAEKLARLSAEPTPSDEAPPETNDSRAADETDDDWDVSDYFSRPASAEPEPDTLE